MDLEQGFRIAQWEVFPLEGRLLGPGGEAVHVEPKAMEVLVDLARHAPAVRTREQIEHAVWARGYVSADVLTRCIGVLRRAFGDDARAPALLETIPKRGYRLRTAAQPVVSASAEASPASLVVLPFRRLTAATAEYLAEGVTELLTLRLSSLRDVRIVSHTTAMQFASTRLALPEVAARTGARWIVEGSVLQEGEQVQVVARLIDARTDTNAWASDFRAGLGKLLALQNDLADRIAVAIRARLGAAGAGAPTLTPAAMRDYLRGRHLMSRRTAPALREAIQAMEAVGAAAPDHAAAWASRAECEMLLMHYGAGPASELLAACEHHLERALKLDPDLAMGLALRGATRFFFALDFDGAVRDLERGLALLPSYSLAMLQMANIAAARHQFAEASAWIAQALLVDPLDVGVNMNLGDHMLLQRRYADAVHALRQALDIAPEHRPSQLRLAWALALHGDAQAARDVLAKSGPRDDADASWSEYAALVEAAAGNQVGAAKHDAQLHRLAATQHVAAWSLARSAAAAGRREAALAALDVARQERSSSWPFLRLTPAFDTLRDDPQFELLAARLPRAAEGQANAAGASKGNAPPASARRRAGAPRIA